MAEPLQIFLACLPGIEPILAAEAHERGFADVAEVPGGVTVTVTGGWQEVWRANLSPRTTDRVLARVAEFRAMHPAQLDKRARKVDWAAVLPRGAAVQVDAVCRKSKIYHAGAARDRVRKAIRDALGPAGKDEPLRVSVRIEDDLCTISLDTSGEPLYRRGYKQAVGKAPMRDTLAAAFLRACSYDGTGTVVDPMCGSGTFLLEAAGMAAGALPGAHRSFAFEALPSFDEAGFAAMKSNNPTGATGSFLGFDRDAGSVRMATENAARLDVPGVSIARAAISDLQRPDGPPGLVIVNPPYGARIGNRKMLFSLYGALGKVLTERFAGWRVGLVTSDGGLAKATGLGMAPVLQVPHGGLKVTLWTSDLP